jgi:large subunit ribosomal protein L3
MEKAIIGKKVGMTQIFDEAGKVIPVTVIQAGPCTVVQKKTEEKDGYTAVQLGFDEVPERKLTKPELGHSKKAGKVLRVLKEFKLDNAAELNVGDQITATAFAAGDRVDVTGISKGKGFQGAVKRCNTAIQKKSHGGGPVHRHAGSMGATTDPSRIFKGKNGAGQMGNEQVTVMNLDVVQVDEELGVIAVRGAIPGPKGGVVALRTSVKKVAEKQIVEAGRVNPQKASARVNPQKASARNK